MKAIYICDGKRGCKNCRYYDAENHNCLDEMGYARIWNENDFCSFGERRQNDFEGGN